MSEESKNTTEEVQFPLNKILLEESAKIKEEREVIKERLAKIEASKTEVSESVYDRVKGDYNEKLEENTNALLEKKQDIDRELATLYEAKKKVTENVETHREQLEEINFRHSLGEFDEEDFNKSANEANEKLGKFEKILAAIENNIEQYESLFEDEEGGFEEPIEETPPPPPPSEIAQETDIHSAPETAEDEGYDVGGDDYFAANTEEVVAPETAGEHTNPALEETGRTPISIDEIEGEHKAKFELIEGEGTGDIFELTEEEMTIGRASTNHIILKEAKISRQHALIKKQGSEFLIEDLHSSNGVFVNDEKINEHALSDGDLVKIGDFVLKFSA